MKNKGIIEQVRAFGEDLAKQENWREVDDKAVVVLALDAEDSIACTVGLGDKRIIEIMLYGFLTQEEHKELRHRLTKALALKMAQELDADKRITEAITNQTAN